MSAEPAAGWRLGLELAWDGLNYENSPGYPQRDDELVTAAASVSRFMGDAELFCRLRYQHNDSTVAEKAFNQTVTHCGLAWDF